MSEVQLYYALPGLMGAAIVLATLGVLARYTSPGPTKTALTVLAGSAFVYCLGDGLARLAAVGDFQLAAASWNTVRFFGIALVPPALIHLAGAYSRFFERPWFRPALALTYAAALVFIALRVGTTLIVKETHVGQGVVFATVGTGFPAFGAFGFGCSLAAVFLFIQGLDAATSTLERLNARRGAVAAILPFGAALGYFALFHEASSPVLDPIVPFLTISVVLYAGTLFSHEVPAATLAAIRAIFATLPDGLVVVDRRGLVTFANPAGNAMLGHGNPGIEGNPLVPSLGSGGLPPAVQERLKSAYEDVALARHERTEVDFETPRPGPRAVHAVVAAAEVGGLSRRLGGPFEARDRFVFFALHDETAVRSREIMLSRANEVKDLFISMIGHDLKAPINAITGYSELIALDAQSSPDALAVYRYSQSVLASARQIQLMMENARLFSRLVDPQDILRARESVELAGLVEREAANLKGAADRRGISVEVQVDPGAAHAMVFAAPIIRSVFQNLIDNAIKYTPDKSKVTVALRAGKDALEIDVEDEGPGIPADKREAIFRRFTRLEQTRTKTEGLGLGLAISKQVVELHGGTLVAGDREGGRRGARFRVRLPREAKAAGSANAPGAA